MIPPVTIYVPVPAGGGAAVRTGSARGAMRHVEAVTPAAFEKRAPGTDPRGIRDVRPATETPRRHEDRRGAPAPDLRRRPGAGDAPAAAGALRPLAAAGPERLRGVDALYRMVEDFGLDQVHRGAVFDFMV